MSLAKHFEAMAVNNAWSNERLHRACSQLSPAEFDAARVGFFPSLQLTLNHILLVDQAYLADLDGSGRTNGRSAILFSRAAELAVAQRETDRRLIAFCSAQDEASLEREIEIDRGDGAVCHETVRATLAHLFIHQIHHRGQAHAMLASTSAAPPQLDEFFLASDEPRRRDELRRLGLG